MSIRRVVAVVCALMLAACAGRGVAPSGLPTVAASPTPPQSSGPTLVRESFTFLPPPPVSTNAAHHPLYVTADIASVQITLDSVNGSAPTTGGPLSVTTNLTITSCPCVVYGPGVPPGSDTFTLTAYDEPNATGNLIATASPTYTIASGQANNENVTLNGVPAAVSLVAPNATAGTAFRGPASISVTVEDGDGNTILGTYATPVSITDSDTSGASSITTSGSDNPQPGELLSSSDTATLGYNGLAIAPVTIAARAKTASTAASFAPALQPITITTPDLQNPGFAGVDLYATSGTGSTGTFSASEIGWTNAPYNQSFAATTASGCNNVATVAPASGTSFTATVAGAPTPGTCALTLADGAGQSQALTLAYTQFAYTNGVQSIVIPAGVTSIAVTAYGAGGFPGTTVPVGPTGGYGGEAQGIITTAQAGQTMYVVVGGVGTGSLTVAGFNGGGLGESEAGGVGGPGGGASDVRLGNDLLSDRMIVAGGGGGLGTSGSGGNGGGLVGSSGGGAEGGAGAGLSTGGVGGGAAQSGGLGNGGGASTVDGGGGGGGGYYGGGGGAAGGGGGGGSSYYDLLVSSPTTVAGVQSGNGLVILIW